MREQEDNADITQALLLCWVAEDTTDKAVQTTPEVHRPLHTFHLNIKGANVAFLEHGKCECICVSGCDCDCAGECVYEYLCGVRCVCASGGCVCS